MIIFDDLLWRALLAGVLFAGVAGVLGCFVVWRRMAFFGDSLAHGALLGIALALLLGINTNFGVIFICCAFSILLMLLMRRKILANDTLLGILAHSALSLGILTLVFVEGASGNLHSYLFGDIVTVSSGDIYLIAIVGTVVMALLVRKWSSLVLATLNEELAISEGINTSSINLLLLMLVALVVAVAIKIVGILLIASLLIIPPATARLLASSPKEMAVISAIFGVIASTTGILSSAQYDLPTGPSIVACAFFVFVIALLLRWVYALITNSKNKSSAVSQSDETVESQH